MSAKSNSKFTLNRLARKFGRYCFFCRVTLADSVDHLYPQSLGGTSMMINLVPACYDCNQAKADRMPSADELERHRLCWGRTKVAELHPDPDLIAAYMKDREERIAEEARRVRIMVALAREKKQKEWRKAHPPKPPIPLSAIHPKSGLIEGHSITYVPLPEGGMKRVS